MLQWLRTRLNPAGTKLPDPLQQTVYEAAISRMQNVEKDYCAFVESRGRSVSARGRLRARLFGANFCIGAMTVALGPEGHEKTEDVYLSVLLRVLQGISISKGEAESLSKEVLKEQNRALHAEFQNVGSGQFALAALYETALEESLGKEFQPRNAGQFLGKVVGENLAAWADTYSKITNRPMQTYQEGFRPSAKDVRPLPED